MTEKFNGPLVLAIMDGWGISPYKKGNPLPDAKTPFIDKLFQEYPNSKLVASGKKVGLPLSQRGNSEAGHLNIGAGRIIQQDVVLINHEIEEGRFFKNPAFVAVCNHVVKNKSQMHLIGLLSGNQSPHVEMNHVYALLRLMDQHGIDKVFLHLFTDGRDAQPHDALKHIARLRDKLLGTEKIATISGRFYGMDRDKHWDRTRSVYELICQGKGLPAVSAEEAVIQAYNRGESDEFISPTVIMENNKPVCTVKDNDGIIFFNLRSDRARQLSKVFVQKDFCDRNQQCFVRHYWPENLRFVAMTDFGPDLDNILTAYPSRDITETLPMVLHNYKQLYIAETEKYAHITFFINGGYANPVAGEERVLIPSPQVKFYAETPAMSAVELTRVLVDKVKNEHKQFVAANYCNPDMIGHTGNMQAAIQAMEALDGCLKTLVEEILKLNGIVIITADHGNVEEMINLKTGEMNTEHSNFPVPFVLVSNQYKNAKVKDGILADVTPTILDIFGVTKPKVMTGKSLLIK